MCDLTVKVRRHAGFYKFRVFKPRRTVRKNGYLFPLNSEKNITYCLYYFFKGLKLL